MNKPETILLPSPSATLNLDIDTAEADFSLSAALLFILLSALVLGLLIKVFELFFPVKKTSFVTIFLLLTANFMLLTILFLMTAY